MTFMYLATPYSKYEGGIDEAFKLACRARAALMRLGLSVYSPIVHCHPVAIEGNIDPLDHEIWLRDDRPFMLAAHSLIVLKAKGWDVSYGIGEEIKTFKEQHKPIFYMNGLEAPIIFSVTP